MQAKTIDELIFVAFDTETTGLSPVAAQLVELSGVKFKASGEVVDTFSTLINPEQAIPPEVTAIHGITDEMVAGQPVWREAVPQFLNWLGGDDTVLLAHNANFDVGFIYVAIARLGRPHPENPVVDTLSMARRLVNDAPNHQLKTLTEHLQLESGGFHRALADSYHVKDLTIKLLSLGEIETLTHLLDFADVFYLKPMDEPTGKKPKVLKSIEKAIADGLDIGMIYGTAASWARTVTPQSVLNFRGTFYLQALCHHSGIEKTFRIDRIVEVKPRAQARP
jgi:DNA polymerase III epsilon subunit family exonuclease